MDRRDFLFSSVLGISACSSIASLEAQIPDNPFTLGVASGDATADAVILWTRLAPQPQSDDGGMPANDVPVLWELALDANMSQIVQRGEAIASRELAHSVHVDARGLAANQQYWYRFRIGRYTSTTGRTKTLPSADATLKSARFITTSCQNYAHGYFNAYRHMIEDDADFVIHLGDYLYDTSFGVNFRQHETQSPPQTLNEFRKRHATYKSDPDLRAAHTRLPFYTTIDNHDAIDDADPARFSQRAAAYQAWYEHMPVRGYDPAVPNRFDLKRVLALGGLAQISYIDVRQFRDAKAVCGNNDYPDYGFGNYRERCAAMLDAERSMLGQDQERWLTQQLAGNRATWNVLASPGPFLPYSYAHDGKDLRYIGAWDAYPANRRRVAQALERANVGHPLILSGDVHSFWAMDGRRVPMNNERFDVTEFVTSSVTANWPAPLDQPVVANLTRNEHVQFYDGNKRGYLLHDVSPTQWVTTARAIDDVTQRDSQAHDLARFSVTHGTKGFSVTDVS
ncbi:MAG: alkaline phosphatase D family protein [Pseudomonadota bacterium]